MTDDETPAVSVRRFNAQVAITIDDVSDHNLWADLTMDLAAGGVFVATYQPLSLGTSVDLEVGIADEEPIHAKGVVRWTRVHMDGSDLPAGVGIKFVELDAETRDRLQRFAETVRTPIVFELEDAPMRRRRRSSDDLHA